MKRVQLVGLVAAALACAACGDGSEECGAGTNDVNGVCVPIDGGANVVCGEGTMLDPASDTCVPAGDICSDGTVFVSGKCQDPSAGLAIDLEEGPEPNGLGATDEPAGIINLKPIGDANGFVIHGCIVPTTDTADLDSYQLTIAAPTLIHVSADGVAGLSGGFVAVAPSIADMTAWERFGVNLSGDLSRRDIYLPEAGTYKLAITDSRSLIAFIDGGGVDVLPPAGNPDGTSCYYVTVDQEAIDAQPFTLPTSGNVAASGTLGDHLKFYSAAAGVIPQGFVELTNQMSTSHVASAIIVQYGSQSQRVDGLLGEPASISFGGVQPTDSVLVVADYVWNYAIPDPDFALVVNAALAAQPLVTDGDPYTINDTTVGQQEGPGINGLNLYYFDVAAAGDVAYFSLNFSVPVQGIIADPAGLSWGDFGGLGAVAGFDSTFQTWTSYLGQWRAPAAGRYYLALLAPRSDVGTPFTLQYRAISQTPQTQSVPNDFGSQTYYLDFSHTADPWDVFVGTSDNPANQLAVTLYDPAKAYGRLDGLAETNGDIANPPFWAPDYAVQPAITSFACPEMFPNCSGVVSGDGVTQFPYVLRALPTTHLLLHVRATDETVSADVNVAHRDYINLGDLTESGSIDRTGDTLPATGALRYYFTAAPGTAVSFAANATSPVTPAFELLDAAENVLGTTSTLALTVPDSGYVAFDVRDTSGTGGPIEITGPITEPYYLAIPDTTTVITDACAGGTVQTLHPTTGQYAASDEGLTSPIALPAGFTFYGVALDSMIASSNGFLSADLGLTDSMFSPGPLGNFDSDVNIAPYWQDAENIQICTQTVGTRLIVQWTGDLFSAPVTYQAILDGADSSIRFAYPAAMMQTGAEQNLSGYFPIAGVQSTDGTSTSTTGDGADGAFVTPNSVVQLQH
ncbi:MAG TPA: hypothetical protein VGM88_33115 [Kofleriaceae bacterium]